jgi:four helix bundle protein
MQRFTDLKVWQRAQGLAVRLYRLSGGFADDDLRVQLRRASMSAPANIAEGAKRAHPRDYARFLNQAAASLAEAHSHLRFATELGVVTEATADELIDEIDQISRMLSALRRKVLISGRCS